MRRHRIVLLGGAAALGVALSAIQVLPSAAWTRHSERATYDQPRSIYEAASEFARSFENPVTGDPDGLDLDTLDPDDPHASANAGERPSPPPAPLTQRVVAGLFGRPASGTHHEQAYQFSVAPWRLPEFLWANVSGRLFPENHRWLNVIPAEGRVWNPSLYMGLLPLVLAMSVLRPWGRRVRQRWLSWAVILAVLAACGWYGIGWLIEELRVGWWGGDPKNAIIGQPVGGLYWLMNVLLPGYVYFRFPAKLLVVAAMGLSVLAAWGWDRMTSHGWRAARRWLAGIAICSAFAALGVLLVQFQNLHFNWFDTVAADPVFGPLDSDGALWDVMFSLLQATVLSVVLLAVLRASVYLGTARLGAIVLWITAIDLVVAHAWSIPTVPTSLSVGPSAVVGVIDSLDQGWALSDDELASRFRLHRGSPARWRPDRWSRETDPARMAAIIAWERDTLFPKYPLVNDTWLVEAYGTISSADFRALLRVARDHGPRVRGGSAEPHPAVLRALHANYVLLPAGNELPGGTALPFVRVADDAQLWRLDQTWPRAWVVRDVRRLPRLRHPSRAALETRARDVFFPAGRPRDLRRTAVIETLSVIETPSVIEAPSAIDAGRTLGPFGPESDLQTDPNGEPQRDPATHRETSDTCRITHDSPLRVEITAQLSRPGLLVLSDLYADGWTAYWDDGRQIPVGRQTPVVLPIHRANRIMRSVWLPAGKSRLTFVYRPLAFYVGAAISLVAWCLVIAASRRLIYK